MMKADFLVVGSGIAGLNFAIQASEHGSVLLLTKKKMLESNTNLAQGGIAAVFSAKDTFSLHMKDTLKAGDGLCDREAVEIMVKNAPEEIEKLISLGTAFDREGNTLALGMEGGHSRKRIVHRGDMTGAEVEKAMIRRVKSDRHIRILENHLAFDLILKGGRCIGVRALDKTNGRSVDCFANAVTLATGGMCGFYSNTSNPDIATGDGVAMGFRAGCEVEDVEFVQFHPTALRRKGKPFFIISEAVRGEGGVLRNSKGKRFVDELGSRDVVARAIFNELKKGKVYLDMRKMGAAFVKKRFPTIHRTCLENGIDVSREMLPVEPVAHYACGGLRTDTEGKTNIRGLFAFGEVACNGVHGANRLASNSLLESLVFSSRAVDAARTYVAGKEIDFANTPQPTLSKTRPLEIKEALKSVMWQKVGIVRNEEGLRAALKKIAALNAELRKAAGNAINLDIIEIRNMLTAARLTAYAALARNESRGCHFREDYPEKEKAWERHLVLTSERVESI
jgi:L-aspartate oxidase